MHGTLHSTLSQLLSYHMQRHIPYRAFLSSYRHRHQYNPTSHTKPFLLRSNSPILDTELTTEPEHLP